MDQSVSFAAVIGIDWDHQKHAVCLFDAANRKGEQGQFDNTPEAILAWVNSLRERFAGRPVGICLEQSRGSLVYALMQFEFLVLFPLNPKQLSDYRAAVYPSGAKTDPNDAELLARFLRDHMDKLRAWHPDDVITRGLRLLTEQRREWVQDRVARTNELLQRLKETYRLALDLCPGDLWGESLLALLQKFPSQRELQRASPKQLQQWLPKTRRAVDDPPPEELLRERIAAIRKALPMTSDAAVLQHSRLAITHLVAMIQTLNQAVDECDAQIAELFAKHPDAELFASFPGAGKALAPRLAAAYGTDRAKYCAASEMQQLSGIAPITKASGKTRVTHMRWACPKFLRQTFHEFAGCSVRYSAWAQAYVKMRKDAGYRYHDTIRCLAFKWQRILFRCWKSRKPYDESRYLQQLRSAGSKLINFLPTETHT